MLVGGIDKKASISSLFFCQIAADVAFRYARFKNFCNSEKCESVNELLTQKLQIIISD